MAPETKDRWLRRLLFTGDIFLFFLYLSRDLHDLMFGQSVSEMPRGDLNMFLIFGAGTLLYCYAVITAMVQRYSTVYLAALKQYGLRRTILFVAAYFSFLLALTHLLGYTGLGPENGPAPAQPPAMQLFALVSSLAGLVLSVKYYRFLGAQRQTLRRSLSH